MGRNEATEGPAPLLETRKKWYEIKADVLPQKISFKEMKPADVEELKKEAQRLLDHDCDLYWRSRLRSSNKSDFMWMKTVLAGGTLSDKLAANTSLIQDSAIHNINCIQNLVNLLNPKSKRECLMALDNLRELFTTELLIENMKLKKFEDQVKLLPEKRDDRRKKLLILFLVEDKLSHFFKTFLEVVDHLAHSDFDAGKDKAVVVLYELFVSTPEQEQFLLQKLVNKLGDPSPKRASKVSHFLNMVVNEDHPAMKLIVVEEVERFLYRPNISPKAQYYGLLFLNGIIFTDGDTPLANKLIKLYLNFFKKSLNKGKEMEQKMMRILLSGVSRSFPYSDLKAAAIEEHLDTFYKTIHFVHLSVAVQILSLILNVLSMDKSGLMSDRFYCVLYRTLLECRLDSCSRKASYLNVLFCALKKDSCLKRIKAFVKRLLQVALNSSSSDASGILMVVSEIVKLKPELALIQTDSKGDLGSDDEDEDEESYQDVCSSDGGAVEDDRSRVAARKNTSRKASWIHNRNRSEESKGDKYDRFHRNPMYANAEAEQFWELSTLQTHYHPSVSLFANTVTSKKAIQYDGDPLTDFTVKHFLERFVFRNPKKVKQTESGASKQKNVFCRSNLKRVPGPDVKSLANIPEDKINLEDRFIHKYLINRISTSQTVDDDIESVTSEDFERLLERYEPGFEKDFAAEFTFGKTRKSHKQSEIDSQVDSEDEILESEDEDLDLDDDEEYQKAFEDVDDDLKDAFDDTNVEIPKKHKKKGLSKDLSSLFASADKFAELLEQNSASSGEDDDEIANERQSDDGGSEDDHDQGNSQKSNKMKRKRKKQFLQKNKRSKDKGRRRAKH